METSLLSSTNAKKPQLRYENKCEIRIFLSRFWFDLRWINNLQRSDLTRIDAWYPRNVKLDWLGDSCEKLSANEVCTRAICPCPNVFWLIKKKVSNAVFIQLFTTYITKEENILYLTSICFNNEQLCKKEISLSFSEFHCCYLICL